MSLLFLCVTLIPRVASMLHLSLSLSSSPPLWLVYREPPSFPAFCCLAFSITTRYVICSCLLSFLAYPVVPLFLSCHIFPQPWRHNPAPHFPALYCLHTSRHSCCSSVTHFSSPIHTCRCICLDFCLRLRRLPWNIPTIHRNSYFL